MLTIIACDVMREELLNLKPSAELQFRFISMGLHRWPERLKDELVRVLAEDIPEGTSAIVFGFGLCGGALSGLKAPGIPLVIPKVHDCIPLLIGSRSEYSRELEREKGTYFLTGGWLEGERTLLTEYHRVRNRHGESKARKVIATMLDSYRRILFVTTGHPRQEERLAEARELSSLVELPLEIRSSSSVWLEQLINGSWQSDNFIVVEPHGTISEALFSNADLLSPPVLQA
ncbi:MAG: DUF1638 domain-containing protein [Desulfuromonadaceae bacterium]